MRATIRGWRPSATGLVVVAGGLVIAGVLAVAAEAAHDDNEDRLLQQRSREAAAVLEAAVPSITSPLQVAASIEAVVERGDVSVLERTLGSQVGPEGRYVSLAVWPVDGLEPVGVVGAAPKLGRRPPAAIRAFLDRSVATGDLTVSNLLDGDDPRLGYATTGPGGSARYVVYAEQALRPDRTASTPSDSAFDDLEYALYLGSQERSATLVTASTADLPITGRRGVAEVALGDETLRLVASPGAELGGSLLARLPMLVLVTGVITSLAAGALVERLQRQRAHAELLALENEGLYAEQRAASTLLQQSLLPKALPAVEGVEVAARYLAGVTGTHVGGDWYDVVDRGGTVGIVVGDVSGHGLAAASAMAAVRHTVRTLVGQGLAPTEVLACADELGEGPGSGHFATVVCGLVEVGPRRATFADAGHPRPLVITDGAATWLDVPVGPPLGAGVATGYEPLTVELRPGATLLLVTDGLFERRGESIDVGAERLRAAAERVGATDGPLEAVLDRLVAELVDGPAADDVALLAVRWPGG